MSNVKFFVNIHMQHVERWLQFIIMKEMLWNVFRRKSYLYAINARFRIIKNAFEQSLCAGREITIIVKKNNISYDATNGALKWMVFFDLNRKKEREFTKLYLSYAHIR